MTDKPKLTPQSIRMFLEVAAKHTAKELKGIFSAERANYSVFNFVNKLVVSKAYRDCSSVAYYDIYRANFTSCGKNAGFTVTFKEYAYKFSRYVFLPFQPAYKLVEFLQPGHIELYVASLNTPSKFYTVQKMFEMCAKDAKISLNLARDVSQFDSRKLLKYCALLIRELYCDLNVLDTKEVFHFPKLCVLRFKEPMRAGLFAHVLKYSVNKLRIKITSFDYLEQIANALVDVENLALNELQFDYTSSDYRELDKRVGKFVSIVCKSCPNLQRVSLKAYILKQNFQGTLLGIVSEYVKRMGALKNFIAIDSVVFTSEVVVDLLVVTWTPIPDWMAEICEDIAFADWDVYGTSNIDLTGSHDDTLKMSFTEPQCEMKFAIWGHFIKPRNYGERVHRGDDE